MGTISITDCQGLPNNMFLSIHNKQNNLGSNTTRWRGQTMPRVAKLLSIFTKISKPYTTEYFSKLNFTHHQVYRATTL